MIKYNEVTTKLKEFYIFSASESYILSSNPPNTKRITSRFTNVILKCIKQRTSEIQMEEKWERSLFATAADLCKYGILRMMKDFTVESIGIIQVSVYII